MIKIIKQTRVMEPETIEKNEVSLRNLLICAFLLLAFCGFTNKAVGQSWSLSNGTLTISNDAAFSTTPYPWASSSDTITKLDIGSGVTSIPYNAFSGYKNLTNVTIEEGTESLYLDNSFYGTFYGSTIGNLQLYRDISYSYNNGDSPFNVFTSLTSLTIGNKVTSIPANCFNGCRNLTSVTFGSGLTSIGDDAFMNCTSLASPLNIPSGVKTIGNYAFNNCATAPSLIIPGSVDSIGNSAFGSCSSLASVTIEEGNEPLYLDNSVYGIFYGSTIGNLQLYRDISYSYNSGNSPFNVFTTLTSLTIGNKVTSIPANCFNGCRNLTSVTFGSGLTSIGDDAFMNCTSLASPLNIPSGVKTIGNYAFNNCATAPSLIIPGSVDSIGNSAFGSCSSLASVTIEEGNEPLYLDNSVYGIFYGSAIGNLQLYRDISYSYNNGDSPFNVFTSLTSLTIGNKVTSIPANCFNGCRGITKITCYATTPPIIQSNTFYNVNKNIPVYIDCNYLIAYQTAQYWSDFTNYQCLTGIENVAANNQLVISPNPAKDVVSISSTSPVKKVEIYSLSGALLLSDNNFNGTIAVSSLRKGIYLVKVYTDSGMEVNKIVKE